MLDDERAGFDEIAGVDILDAFDLLDDGMMDVAADDAVGAAAPGLAGELLLERADEIDRILHLQLGPGRERPVVEAKQAAHRVEMGVDEDREIVGPVAEEREPFGMAHDDVEFVAVHDEEVAAVGSGVGDVASDLDAAEGEPDELARELVVIARHEHHARAAPHLAQQLLDHVVVSLRPIEARAHAPAVDDVADEIVGLGIVVAQEVEHQLRLAAACSQVNVGKEDRAVAVDGVEGLVHGGRTARRSRNYMTRLLAQILMSPR